MAGKRQRIPLASHTALQSPQPAVRPARIMRITALCGGVGGAKLALGLQHAARDLTLVVNTGDDFTHGGLPICPDIDTVLYTLSGKANAAQGWGREGESFAVQDEWRALGEDPWFTLGDKDIALHLIRLRALAAGAALSEVTADLARRLGVSARVVPMCEEPAPTSVDTDEGLLAFQEYFVRRRCAPRVSAIRFGGAGKAAAPVALAAIDAAEGLVLCPSNPLLSIAPILALDGMAEALGRRTVPAVAVSPIVAGSAVKGPTAKIFAELGLEVSALSVARQYAGLIDILVIDGHDAPLAPQIGELGIRAVVAPTLMTTLEDRIALAERCLALLG